LVKVHQKRETHSKECVFFLQSKGLPNPNGFARLASDSKPLANYRLPSPYQGAETRRGHQNKASTFVGAFIFVVFIKRKKEPEII
jgi:hypothetical protein